jgi:hypothetical protein
VFGAGRGGSRGRGQAVASQVGRKPSRPSSVHGGNNHVTLNSPNEDWVGCVSPKFAIKSWPF